MNPLSLVDSVPGDLAPSSEADVRNLFRTAPTRSGASPTGSVSVVFDATVSRAATRSSNVEDGHRASSTVPAVVYGNRWCGRTQMISRGLDRAGIDFQYVDLDLHPEVERRLRLTLGRGRRTPLVYVDGDWHMAPSMRELQHALARHGAW